MLILGIDGALSEPSVAVAREGLVLFSKVGSPKASISRDVLRMVSEGFREYSISAEDISHICVTRGPGSFTGIRAAMATAYGLADATGARVGAVGTLEALAMAAPAVDGPITAVSKARKGIVYSAIYRKTGGAPELVHGPVEAPVENLARQGGGLPLVLIGEGFEEEIAKIRKNAEGAVDIAQKAMPIAAAAAMLAFWRLEKGESFGQSPSPEYIGRSQAELTQGGSGKTQPLYGG